MLKKIVLFGGSGQVGTASLPLLQKFGEVLAPSSQVANFQNPESVLEYLEFHQPSLVYNAAAYTNVDGAEKDFDNALLANGKTVETIAKYCAKTNTPLIHFSTDYVFDGLKTSPYLETDNYNPTSAYGRSKLYGDQAIAKSGAPSFIFRVSWVYAETGKNFKLTMKRLFREREEVKVVNDQVGCPTHANSIAYFCFGVLNQALGSGNFVSFFQKSKGVFHLSTEKPKSWFEFAEEILNAEIKESVEVIKCKKVIPILSSEFPSLVTRPKYSVLCAKKAKDIFNLSL